MLSKIEQDTLVTTHLNIVKWAVKDHIHVDETRCGLGYDDLFQEGCIWLCKAAASYNAEQGGFSAFAKKVVRNGLISYCRHVCGKNKISVLSLDAPIPDLNKADTYASDVPDDFDMSDYDSQLTVFTLLSDLKAEYQGTTRLGIEALEWKLKGYTVTDIARIYGVKPNLIGARISRAACFLRQNPRFTGLFGEIANQNEDTVEQRAA